MFFPQCIYNTPDSLPVSGVHFLCFLFNISCRILNRIMEFEICAQVHFTIVVHKDLKKFFHTIPFFANISPHNGFCNHGMINCTI